MNIELYQPARGKTRARSRNYRIHSSREGRSTDDGGFLCKHCLTYVCAATLLSGVQNRNHCPYCLWSRHLDLWAAGDRLAACKALMRPVGLTVKTTHKKYGTNQGELMLIHACTDCGRLSFNRIAADDDPHKLWGLFEDGLAEADECLPAGFVVSMTAADRETVYVQLFGRQP